jgi:predicted RNase H-like nuclease
MNYIGVDLAWGEGTATKAANETGLVRIDDSGTVLDAGWARGIDQVVEWLVDHSRPGDVIAIDAPLVVANATGMRECEREVAQRYGQWQVYANPSNLGRPWFGGVTLRQRLEDLGFVYSDGRTPPDAHTMQFFECYPYTTLVGAPEFGYEIERPRYKRFNPALPSLAARRDFRAAECDELLRRMSRLTGASPALNLRSHPVTATLVDAISPLIDAAYKHREDLLDAALCAWTAALWAQFGLGRCQVLGELDAPDSAGRTPVIIAPARPEQRLGGRIARPKRAKSGGKFHERLGSTDVTPTATALLMEATKILDRHHIKDPDRETFDAAREALLAGIDKLTKDQLAPEHQSDSGSGRI